MTPPPKPQRVVLVGVVAGVTILSAALTLSKTFADDGQLPGTSLILAAIWGIGGMALWWLGPKRNTPDAVWQRRPWLWTLAVSAGISGVSFMGGMALLLFPPTSHWVSSALLVASSAPALVTLTVALIAGVAEEVFFRVGFASLWPPTLRWVLPTLAYVLVTLATGNTALTISAALLGLSATAVRERTGVFSAPIVVHAVWTLAMVGLFPVVARLLTT